MTNVPELMKRTPKEDRTSAFDDHWELDSAWLEELADHLPGLEDDTIDSFRMLNRKAGRMPSIETTATSTISIDCVNRDPDSSWPEQVLEFSEVGFSEDARQALVYVGLLQGDAGRGWFFLLDRGEDGWLVEAQIQAWIA